MQFECNKYLGQGLHAVDGFHWADPRGYGIGLSSASAAGSPDANGNRSFRFSWYTQLMPIKLAVVEQQALRADLKQAGPALPRFLNDSVIDEATILELKAITSNGEGKRILLIVPDARPGLPKWLAGFECNGSCFREDTQPMAFSGRPN